jgi:hypothetical protein
MHRPLLPRSFRSASAALFSVLALAACDDSVVDPVDDGEDAVPAIELQRLIVADATAPTARVLALHDSEVLQTIALSAPASLVYRSHTGRFGVVQQRTADRVQFVDSGIEAHGDHFHRDAPSLLPFELSDGLPTHHSVNGDWISVFFDGNGRAVWMRESDKLAGSPRVAFELDSGGAHHSGSATMMVGNNPYFVYAPRNPAGGLPSSVNVRNLQGELVAEVASCPVMHGNAAIASGVVFGCQDGVALFRAGAGGVTAEKIIPTGDMAGLGLRNAYATSGASFILGQFSALPGQPTQRVLALINPATGSIQRLPALPADVRDHTRAVEPVKGQVVLLGTDGALYIYSGSTRQLERRVAGVVPALPASGAAVHQVDVVEGLAAVASPSTGEVVLVSLDTGAIVRRINVGGAPSRLAILGVTEAGLYELEG